MPQIRVSPAPTARPQGPAAPAASVLFVNSANRALPRRGTRYRASPAPGQKPSSYVPPFRLVHISDPHLPPPLGALSGRDLVTKRLLSAIAWRRKGVDHQPAVLAALIADGHSNKAIAAELVISPATVARHVANMMIKLGFRSRAQIAAWVLAALPPVLIGLVMQLKFYLLHYVVLLAPTVVICALLASDVGAWFPERLRKTRVVGPLIFSLAMLFCWSRTLGAGLWLDENKIVVKYLRGEISREEFSRFFALPGIGFWWEDSEKVGLWIKEHSDPEDTIAVRGFEPEIYAVAQRRYPGRFFWTTFLVSPTRGTPEMTERWRAEDLATIERERPRFVVALTGIAEGPDSVAFFEPLGYEVAEVVRNLTLMERSGPGPAH